MKKCRGLRITNHPSETLKYRFLIYGRTSLSMSKKHKKTISFGKYEAPEEKFTLPSGPLDTTFSFKHICTEQHAPKSCSFPQLKSFNDKIRILCSLPWETIEQSPHETNGYEFMPRDQLTRNVPSTVPSSAKIMVFRFGGGSGSQNSGRIAGYKSGQTFYVLF